MFVECLSLHSERYTGDRSELEAYSSALNDVLEQQLSITSAATLENTFDDPLAVSRHNISYEPMDVDDINETMEMLKDVLAPEDHQMLQQQFVVSKYQINPLESNGGQKQGQEQMEESFEILEQLEIIPELGSQERKASQTVPEPAAQLTELNIPPLKSPQKGEELNMEKEELKTVNEELKLAVSQDKTKIFEELSQAEQKQFDEEPPIEEEQEQENPPPQLKEPQMQLSIQQTQQQVQEPLHAEKPLESSSEKEPAALEQSTTEQQTELPSPGPVEPIKGTELKPPEQTRPAAAPLSPPVPTLQAKRDELPLSPPIPTHRPKTAEELEFMALKELPLPEDDGNAEEQKCVRELEQPNKVPMVAITPVSRRPTTPSSLELAGSSSATYNGNRSGPTSPSFPIKGPAEPPSHFPRSPRAPPEQEEMTYLEEALVEPSSDRKQSGYIEAEVIAKSPVVIEVTEPSPQKPHHLNETLPMSDVSPTPLNGTFDSGRRTDATPESVTEGTPLESGTTFDVNLGSISEHQRRTFSISQSTEDRSRSTFNVEKDKPRRTFCLEQNASPAVEATEESVAGDYLEAMDVDVSMRVEEVTVQQQLAQPSVSNSPPIPTHQNLRRPPIHDHGDSPVSPLGNATVVLEQEQALSAKEQAHLSASDEKDDVFVEHFGAISPVSDDMFKTPQFTTSNFHNQAKMKANAAGGAATLIGRTRAGGAGEEEQFFDAEFQDGASNQNCKSTGFFFF